MARPNATGVPGLSQIKSGPRAGRYQLDFHYTCPVERAPKRLGKLYPRELTFDEIKADALVLIESTRHSPSTQTPPGQSRDAANFLGLSFYLSFCGGSEADWGAESADSRHQFSEAAREFLRRMHLDPEVVAKNAMGMNRFERHQKSRAA